MPFFKSIEEFRNAGGAVDLGSTSLEVVEPALVVMADIYLRPVLGDTFFDALAQAYEAATTSAPLTGAQADVVTRIQAALANLGMMDLVDTLQTHISDNGVQIESTSSRKTAFQWQITALKRAYGRKAAGALDRLLICLESKIDDATCADWATSDAAKAAAELLINSAAQFQRHVDIRGSRCTYLSLMPVIRKVEAFDLEPVLGTEFLAEIRELLVDRELVDGSAEKRLVLDFIRPAVAHLTLARALQERAFRLDGSTLELQLVLDDPDGAQQQAGVNATEVLISQQRRAQADADTYLARLTIYLRAKASATLFPTYYASPLYNTGTAAPDPVDAANTSDSPVYYGL